MGHISKLDRFRGENGERSRVSTRWYFFEQTEVSGIKKTGTGTIKNKQAVGKTSNCGLEASQGINERHQHRPSHVKSGELTLSLFFGFLIAGPHF